MPTSKTPFVRIVRPRSLHLLLIGAAVAVLGVYAAEMIWGSRSAARNDGAKTAVAKSSVSDRPDFTRHRKNDSVAGGTTTLSAEPSPTGNAVRTPRVMAPAEHGRASSPDPHSPRDGAADERRREPLEHEQRDGFARFSNPRHPAGEIVPDAASAGGAGHSACVVANATSPREARLGGAEPRSNYKSDLQIPAADNRHSVGALLQSEAVTLVELSELWTWLSATAHVEYIERSVQTLFATIAAVAAPEPSQAPAQESIALIDSLLNDPEIGNRARVFLGHPANDRDSLQCWAKGLGNVGTEATGRFVTDLLIQNTDDGLLADFAADAMIDMIDRGASGPMRNAAMSLSSEEHRRIVADALAHMGTPSTVEGLLALLERPEDQTSRALVMGATQKLKNNGCAPMLGEALRQPSSENQFTVALEGLVVVGDKDAVSELISAYDTSTVPEVKGQIAEGIARIDNPGSLDYYLDVIAERHDAELREALFKVVGRSIAGGHASEDQLADAVTTACSFLDRPAQDEVARKWAAFTLAEIGTTSATEALLGVATRTSPGPERDESLSALSYIRNPLAIPVLEAFASRTADEIHSACVAALVGIGTAQAAESVVRIAQSGALKTEELAATIRNADEPADKGGVEVYSRAVASAEPQVRDLCLAMLANIGDAAAARSLLNLLSTEPEESRRWQIIDALTETKDQDAIPALQQYLASVPHGDAMTAAIDKIVRELEEKRQPASRSGEAIPKPLVTVNGG